MTLKQRFANQHERSKCNANEFSLSNIRNQSPDVYSADSVIPDQSTIRCDYFVLCDRAPSTTGIYVVEAKGGSPNINHVKAQLQSGSDFMSQHLQPSDRFLFLPVLVAKGITKSALLTFQKARINLNGKETRIAHVKPRSSLKSIPLD